jgi:hypothetical protein
MEFRRSSVKEETKEREIKKESKADTRPAVRRSTRKVRHLVAVDEGGRDGILGAAMGQPNTCGKYRKRRSVSAGMGEKRARRNQKFC